MNLISRIQDEFSIPDDEIYLDSATTGKIPKTTIRVLNDFFNSDNVGVNRGTHKYAIRSSRVLENEREKIANLFKLNSRQISFLPSRETAILNALFSLDTEKVNNIIISTLEDHSLLGPSLRYSEMKKANINYISMKDEPRILEILANLENSESSVFIFSALTLGIGVRRKWEEIAKISKDNNITTIMDISYLIGHQRFDFSKNMPDIVISSSSNGALGIPSIGMQFVSESINENLNPLLVGGGAIISLSKEKYKLGNWNIKFEPGTLNIPAIIGLSESLQFLDRIGLEVIENHDKKLRRQLVEGLNKIDNIELIRLEGVEYGPVMSFRSKSIDSHDIAIILEDIQNIIVRSGALCSHLFMEEIQQNSLVQLSTHIYNTEEQIQTVIETVKSIMEEI